MAIIYSYPINTNILATDIIIGSSTVIVNGSPKNQTKSFEVQDLAGFINAGNTLNSVLTNGNTSLLDAKIGELYLYDGPNVNYAKISIQDDLFSVIRATSGTTMFSVENGNNILFNNGTANAVIINSLTTSRTYTLPNATGTFALTSDLLNYVPYTGATGDINIGNNSIYTGGGAKLWDDGTVEGTSFQFLNSTGYLQSGAVSTNQVWTLPDATGTIALTSDIPATPTLQQVVNVGNTIVVPTTVTKGIDITLVDLATVYQNGISVTIPAQTGIYPAFQPAPDAFVANINGQNPGNLTGTPVGFYANAAGEDNIAFFADLTATSGSSRGFETISFDAHTGDYFRARKQISSIETIPFKVANNGDTTANSFIKTGGTSSQFLMADGSVTTNGTLFKASSSTTATGVISVISTAILGSIFTNGSILKIQTMVTFGPSQNLNITPVTYYINTSPSLVGATQIAINDISAGQRYSWMDRSFWSIGGTFNSRNFGNSSQTSVSNSGAALGSTSIPATFYIIASINVGVGDLGTIASVLIEKQ